MYKIKVIIKTKGASMNNLLNEIKQLAQQGLENTIIAKDDKNKDIFLNIMLKSELALNKIPMKNTNSLLPTNKEESSRTYEKIDDDIKMNMYLVAYCFSCYEHTSLYPKFSQDKAFIVAAEQLGVKKNTLKNARDWFDGHNDSHRSGWWQAPLPEDMERAKNVFDNKSRNELISEAQNILEINEVETKSCNFGQSLKSSKYGGKFRSKSEVEEFIDIIVKQSPSVAKDLIEQCSQKTFIACYEIFAKKYNESTESLKHEIVKCDPRTASNSDFSLWIRARFIQEIFKQNLEKDVLDIVN